MNAIHCHRARARFDLYLDGALSRNDVDALENHLFECAACAAAIGEDVHLGETMELALRETGPVAPGAAPRSWGRLRAAAAAVVLLVGGAVLGRVSAPPTGREATRPGNDGELVPMTEVVNEPWLGLASFTDEDLYEAERDALRDKVGLYELKARRFEHEIDFLRPLVEESTTPERIVDSLRDRVQRMDRAQSDRREDGGRMRDVWRHGRVAAMLLQREPEAAFEPVRDWLLTASTPLERRSATKLLASLRLHAAHDLLAEATRDRTTRELALDGLLALRDPRSRALFLEIMEDESLRVDPTRVKAAGGLHRLGDPRGLDFLVAAYREHPAPPDLRRRIVFHVGANPAPHARPVLAELVEGVRLDGRDRAALAEFLVLSGVPDGDPALMHLIDGPSDRERRHPPGRPTRAHE